MVGHTIFLVEKIFLSSKCAYQCNKIPIKNMEFKMFLFNFTLGMICNLFGLRCKNKLISAS